MNLIVNATLKSGEAVCFWLLCAWMEQMQSNWNVSGMEEALKPLPVVSAAQLLWGCESCLSFSLCGQNSPTAGMSSRPTRTRSVYFDRDLCVAVFVSLRIATHRVGPVC